MLAISAAALRRTTRPTGTPSASPPPSAGTTIATRTARSTGPAPSARRAWPTSACIARGRRNAIGAIEVRLVVRRIVAVLVLAVLDRKLLAALNQDLAVVIILVDRSNVSRRSNAARSITVSAAMTAFLANLGKSQLGPLLAQHSLA